MSTPPDWFRVWFSNNDHSGCGCVQKAWALNRKPETPSHREFPKGLSGLTPTSYSKTPTTPMSKLQFTITGEFEFDPMAYEHLELTAMRQGRTLIDVAAEWEQVNCDPSYLVEICDNLKQSVTVLPERKEHGRFTY